MESSASQDYSLFKRCRNHFDSLRYDMLLVTFNSENATSSLFIQYKEELFEFVNSQSTTFLRSDYKEVLEICVFYLKGREFRWFRFMKCGALHKARWMSKIIYSIKIPLLSREILKLPMGTIVTS